MWYRNTKKKTPRNSQRVKHEKKGRSSNQRLFWGGLIIVFRIFPSSYAEKLLGLVAFWCSWNSPRFWSQKKRQRFCHSLPPVVVVFAALLAALHHPLHLFAVGVARHPPEEPAQELDPETMLQIARKKWRIPMILPKKWSEETLIWSTVVFWGCLRFFFRKKKLVTLLVCVLFLFCLGLSWAGRSWWILSFLANENNSYHAKPQPSFIGFTNHISSD